MTARSSEIIYLVPSLARVSDTALELKRFMNASKSCLASVSSPHGLPNLRSQSLIRFSLKQSFEYVGVDIVGDGPRASYDRFRPVVLTRVANALEKLPYIKAV